LNSESAAISRVEGSKGVSKGTNSKGTEKTFVSPTPPVSPLNTTSLSTDDCVKQRLSLVDSYLKANNLFEANSILKEVISIFKKNSDKYPPEELAKAERKSKQFEEGLHMMMMSECFTEYQEAFKAVNISDVVFAYEFSGMIDSLGNSSKGSIDLTNHRKIKFVRITEDSSNVEK
jgi:hypothetical protein